jgi:hypothetical protein
LLLALSILSVAAFVVRYLYQHHVTLSDARGYRIFTLDLWKILLSQTGAWAMNFLLTSAITTATAAAHVQGAAGYQGVGWYASVIIMDMCIGVPLGILLGKGVNRAAQVYLARQNTPQLEALMTPLSSAAAAAPRYGTAGVQVAHGGEHVPPLTPPTCATAFALQNQFYGKYGPVCRTHPLAAEEDDLRRNGYSSEDHCSDLLCGFLCLERRAYDVVEGMTIEVRVSWWLSQTLTWTACVILSRFFSGAIVVASIALLPTAANPVVGTAKAITQWHASCAAKQWLVGGLLRLTVDFTQLALIDFYTKFKALVTSSQIPEPPSTEEDALI